MAASGDQQIELALPGPAEPADRAVAAASRPTRRARRRAAQAAKPEMPLSVDPLPENPPTQEPAAPHGLPAEDAVATVAIAAELENARSHWLVRRMGDFARLIRLDRPIGIWLLLWPELWALWIAAGGHPQRRLLGIFGAGTVLMRSAGCIINDLWDRNIDPHVKRTRARPLAARVIGPYEALLMFAALVGIAGALALQLNTFTLRLAFVGLALTISYPLLKRFFPLPQLYLGLCFGWAVPMAFAATTGEVPRVGWLLLVAAVLWAGVYDTMYAMTDRDDDLKIGVQSSAILFADLDRFMIGVMQLMVLFALLLVGRTMHFGSGYRDGLIGGAIFFLWQQWLIRGRERDACLQAFYNNQYFGIAVFAGVVLEYTSG